MGGAWVVAALQTLLVVFAGLDPLRAGLVACAAPADKACQAALAQPGYPAVCSLPREAWQWTNQ